MGNGPPRVTLRRLLFLAPALTLALHRAMAEEMLITAIRHTAANRLIDQKTLKILMRCPDERIIGSVIDLVVAMLTAVRDPSLRQLAAERGRAN